MLASVDGIGSQVHPQNSNTALNQHCTPLAQVNQHQNDQDLVHTTAMVKTSTLAQAM
jgi:hypothetical protein